MTRKMSQLLHKARLYHKVYKQTLFSVRMIFKSYFFIPSVNVDGDIRPFLSIGWTLIFEMFFYFVFAGALLLGRNIYRFVGFVLFTFALASLFIENRSSPWWYFFNPIILEFYFGMLLGYFALQNKYMSYQVSVVIFFGSLAYLFGSTNILNLPHVIETGVPATLLIWATVSLEPHIKAKIPRPILFYGAASYSLYLFHPLIAPLAPMLLKKSAISSFPISILFSIVLAMTTASIVHLWFEKPLTNFIIVRYRCQGWRT